MKKSTAITVVIILIAFGLGLTLGIRWNSHSATIPLLVLSSSSLPMSIVSMDDASASLYKLSIEYPQFPGAPNDFNASIKNFADSNLADFKQAVTENAAAREATRPSGTPAEKQTQIYYFNVSWDHAQFNAHYISLILRMAAFEGGANESQDVATFNYDFTKHAPVTLQDFFPAKTKALTALAKLAREQLKASLESASPGYVADDMLAQGTQPTTENFKNFTFTDDVLTLYFPKYQVAPGSFGEQRVVIARSSLQ